MTNLTTPNLHFAGFTIIGGNDAPGIRIVPDGHGGWKIERVPGWNPEALLDVAGSLAVLGAASRLRAPGLAQAAINAVAGYAQKEITEHLPAGGVLIVRQ